MTKPASGEPALRTAVRRLGGYREYSPPSDLRDLVAAVWTYARPARGSAPLAGRGHRVLPEPGVSLCLQCRRDAAGAVVDPAVILMGPIRTIRFFAPEPGAHLEGVRLKPEWCRDLLGVDPGEHVDGLDGFDAVDRCIAARLLDRLVLTGHSRAALTVLLNALRELRDARTASDATRLAHAGLERIRGERDSTLRLPAVAAELRVSERHLRRVIRQAAGLGPKRLQRVRRLNRAVAAADGRSRPNWARLAVETGYYDQPHLIREFRLLAGRSPAALHAERRLQTGTPGA